MQRENKTALIERLAKRMTEKNVVRFIIILFIIMSFWVALVPYEPMKWDKADATTNRIWVDNYRAGVYEIPYEDWHYRPTQSVVVEHQRSKIQNICSWS